jgi:(p)ppGpp synthase/HD superfamily hydrolase
MLDAQKENTELFNKYSFKVNDALDIAFEAHEGQLRTNSKQAYIAHPIRVACLLTKFGFSEEHVILGILHDVIEDCAEDKRQYFISAIVSKFGNDIMNDLLSLTKVSKKEDGNRKVRTQIDIIHYCGASKRAQEVKICDCLDNLSDVTTIGDIEFAKRYNKEKELLAIAFAEQGKCDSHLLDKLFKQIKDNEAQMDK